jgi:glutamyl-tRNA synthetase
MSERKIRVRFAPSPTGELHMGSVRTALFNYLFAKAYDGLMILRIEDTDEKRSTDESLQTIINGLRWCGIDWDEGPEKGGISPPYFQSERLPMHQEYARKLMELGKTYYCDCTSEESEDCHCFEKNQDELKNSGKAAIRFKVPPGVTEVHDQIQGNVSFKNEDIKDFVILKSNGHPVYNFAVVVDDITMGVTHIIRGNDHLSNTPKQILLYNAFGIEPPAIAHQPLILSPLGGKLSKRQLTKPQNEPNSPNYVPAVNVEWYREHGFLPEAFVNYLAKLCWNDGTENEFYTLDELIKVFKIEDVTNTPALYDWKKLKWYNGMYMRKLSPEEYLKRCLPFLIKTYGEDILNDKNDEWIQKLLLIYQERIEYFDEIGEKVRYIFERPTKFDQDDLKKVKWDNEGSELLKEFVIDICYKSDFSTESLEAVTHNFVETKQIKAGRILQIVRLAVSGTRATPGIYDILFLLGKSEVKERITSFVDNIPFIQ